MSTLVYSSVRNVCCCVVMVTLHRMILFSVFSYTHLTLACGGVWFSGGKKVGINPKINNLMPGYEGAKYGLVWICDSGIRGQRPLQVTSPLAGHNVANANVCACLCAAVKPDSLTDMTNQMTEKVGLVHGLPYVADRQGFAATLEQVRLTS